MISRIADRSIAFELIAIIVQHDRSIYTILFRKVVFACAHHEIVEDSLELSTRTVLVMLATQRSFQFQNFHVLCQYVASRNFANF
jgi:hypothetical protein